LIGGTGRSGTTILRKVFATHPDVVDIPEWRFTVDPDGIVDFYRSVTDCWSPINYHCKAKRLIALLDHVGRRRFSGRALRLLRRVTSRRFQHKWHLRPRYERINVSYQIPAFPTLVQELEERLTELPFEGSWRGMRTLSRRQLVYGTFPNSERLAAALGDFWRELADEVCDIQDASVYCEKNTWNILFFDSIRELLPDARLVHIYRDPRDVVASFSSSKHGWTPDDPIQSADVYCSLLKRWQVVRDRLPQECYREISLESLTENPQSILRDLSGFLDIPWHESLLSIPLNKSNSGRWKRDIPQEKHDRINHMLRGPLEQYGYR